VTSSDCSLGGLTAGVGLRTNDVDYTLSIVKAPYMTRVGDGPFPTELGGARSAAWCNSSVASRKTELERYPKARLNDAKDDFEQGVAIRRAGNEYGATTGRARRVGWLDIPLLRYAARFGSRNLAITKADVLSECRRIPICTQYRYDGEDYRVGEITLTRGTLLDTAIMDSFVLERCHPIYTDLPGWCCSLEGIRAASELPKQLHSIILAIEKLADVQVDVLSIGPDRDETIVL
jgi:adenylosuccinate synthase